MLVFFIYLLSHRNNLDVIKEIVPSDPRNTAAYTSGMPVFFGLNVINSTVAKNATNKNTLITRNVFEFFIY